MKANTFKSSPHFFLPNVQDGHLEKTRTRYPAILMSSHHIEWLPKVAEKMKNITDTFIIDPSSDILLFKDAKEGKSFKKLGYPKMIETEKLYSDPEFRKEKIIHHAVDDQIQKGASVVIAPYFFSEDTDDTKFGLNISLLSETIRYLEETQNSIPVFAMLELGSSILNRPTVINYIVDRYKDDFKDVVSGYIVVINDLDCERADQEALLELSRLVFQLSENNSVIVNRMGPFGEILIAVGASGFGSGLAKGETFQAKNLQTKPSGWKKKIQKTYIPEIFDYLNDEAVKKIKYSCSCPFCNGSYPKDNESKKLHFLHTRIEAARSLAGMSRTEKIELVTNKIDSAIKFTSRLRKQAIDVKTAYLPRWKAILELTKFWDFPGEDKELDSLLSELDS